MGWGAIYVISMNAHIRLNVIFAKLFFGALGVTIFGIAVQLMGYTRQLVFGLIVGLDAVFASLTNTKENSQSLKKQVLTGNKCYSGNYSPEIVAKQWLYLNDKIISDGSTVNHFHKVSYEDSMNNPDIVLGEIFNFLNLEKPELGWKRA